MTQRASLSDKVIGTTVLIASFGYLIDMFDFLLFNVLRIKSLTSLGLSAQNLTDAGLFISNAQIAGILIGALCWGIIGDKFGRKTGLFWSIGVYTIGSLASAFVFAVHTYALARFVTGFGLSGELGAGIALITEKMTAEKRGNGIMIFISFGCIGVLLAATAAQYLPWRTCYLIGAVVGALLFFARMALTEFDLYLSSREGKRPDLFKLFRRDPRYLRYFASAFCLMAVCTYVPQILWTLSPEIGRDINLPVSIQVPVVLGLGYSIGAVCDLIASFLSNKWRSRKKAVFVFWLVSVLAVAWYIILPPHTSTGFYIFNGLFALTFGVWTMTACWIAEHVPTNIRATIATATPAFARGLTIPMNLAYGTLKTGGALHAAGIIGCVIFILAFLGWLGLRETYGRDLNYTE